MSVSPLEIYGTNAPATTVATAGLLTNVTGASGNGQSTTKCGTSTGFSEIYGQGTTGAWGGAGSIGAPGPNGWLFDSTILEGQTIPSGAYTLKIRAKISVGTATVDMWVVVFKRSSAGVYTKIGTCSLLAQSLSTAIQNYNFAGTNLYAMSFGVGDKLGYNVWFNITVNGSGSGGATIGFTNANSATLGRASNADLNTPGYQKTTLGFGMTFGLNPGDGIVATNFANWTNLLADLAVLNVKKVRFQLSWDSIEVPQGTYNWGALDDAVSHLNAAGIEIIFPIRNAPTWALTTASQQSTDQPWYLADPTLFAGFCTAVATRYNGGVNGHIDRFEICNEEANVHDDPNNSGLHALKASTSPYWGALANAVITTTNKYRPSRDPQFYVPILLAAYPAIKAVLPNVPVGMGAMFWLQPANDGIYGQPLSQMATFLTYMYANGCKGNMDYIQWHYYSNNVSDIVGSNQVATIATIINECEAVVAANNDTIKAKIGEFGWQVPTDVATGALQWMQYLNLMEAARLSGFVDEVDFYTLGYTANFGSGSSLTSIDNSIESYQQPTFPNLRNYIAQQTGGGQSMTIPQQSRHHFGKVA